MSTHTKDLPKTCRGLRSFIAARRIKRISIAAAYGCWPSWIGGVLNESEPARPETIEKVRVAIVQVLDERERAGRGN